MGNSYKCSAEERLHITPAFVLNLFSVQVQAFKVEGDRFGSGECTADLARCWLAREGGQGWQG